MSNYITRLIDQNGTQNICWDENGNISGKNGWCKVNQNLWGFCQDSCQKKQSQFSQNQREISNLKIIPSKTCSQLLVKKHLNFDPNYDLCAAAQQTRPNFATFKVLKIGQSLIFKRLKSKFAAKKQNLKSFFGGNDACIGDSGGPLWTWTQDQKAVQIGLVSRGLGCGRFNEPGLYVKIAPYLNWISSIIKNISLISK